MSTSLRVCDKQYPTHDHRWVYGVSEERRILRIWDEVYPPELDIDS
jgi:hypothetical protein